MTTPSMMIFLHRNDGVPPAAGAGMRLRVLLRPGAHTLQHVLDDATKRLGLRTAATGICRPDGTAIRRLDDLTPKCDVVVLEGRKGFVHPRQRSRTPQRQRTPPRSAGRRAPELGLSTTPRSAVPGWLPDASQSTAADSLRSVVVKPLQAETCGQSEVDSETPSAQDSGPLVPIETDQGPARPTTLHIEPTETRIPESPAQRPATRVTCSNAVREAALQRRGQRPSRNRKSKLAVQLLENRQKHEAAKQAKLKRGLAATRQDLIASRDIEGDSSGVPTIQTPSAPQVIDPPSPRAQARLFQRAAENLAETWTPPPLERISSIDSSVTTASSPTGTISVGKASASWDTDQPMFKPEPEPEQEPDVVRHTYADLYLQVREIHSTARSTLQGQLGTTAESAHPLLVRLGDLVAELDNLAADIGAMPAGATVGSTVKLYTAGSGPPQQQRHNPPPLPNILPHTADNGVVDENAAATVIQVHVRGRQDRRRVAAMKLVALRETRDDSGFEGDCCLDLPIDQWLAAQNEYTLSDKLEDEFGIQSLWDLVAVIQDPWDLNAVLPEPAPARCDALWRAMQHLIAQASEETDRWLGSRPLTSHHGLFPSGAALAENYGSYGNNVRRPGDGDGDPIGSFALARSSPASSTRSLPPLPKTYSYSGTSKGKEGAHSIEMRTSPGQSPAEKENGKAAKGLFTPTSFRA